MNEEQRPDLSQPETPTAPGPAFDAEGFVGRCRRYKSMVPLVGEWDEDADDLVAELCAALAQIAEAKNT